MISSRLLIVLAASLVCASSGHCQPLDQASVAPSPVVVQPHDQITQDLKSAAPESDAKLQPAGDIPAQLTAIANAEKPPSPTQILPKDEELARLKALPASSVPLKQARLYTAVVALAEEAGMRYIAPAESDFAERISLNIAGMNPKDMLDVLSQTYGFTEEYDDHGIWHFYRADQNEMIPKTYSLRFNNLSKVVITSPSINANLNTSNGSYSANPQTAARSSDSPFKVDADHIVSDIKQILGIPATAIIDDGRGTEPEGAYKSAAAPTPQVIWNPDNNELLVFATRQQHTMIKRYLKMVDRPQRLVRLAVKFVETARDPRTDFGIDWSGTSIGPNGGPISLSGTGGPGTPLATAPFSLAHPGNVQLPQAILSSQALQLTLHAFATDSTSAVVQDPVLVTSNNREVTFKDTTQQPVQQSSTNIGQATTTSTSQIVYLEVGPIVSILPTILPGSRPGHELIQLNISIVTSRITSQSIIAGNTYPVLSSKTYEYSVAVENGFTLAIAGLDERTHTTTANKVPVLGSLPIIGHAFNSTSDETVTTKLVAFITPTIENPGADPSLATTHPVPISNRRIFDGSPNETLEDLQKSLGRMNADIQALQSAADASNRGLVINRLDRIGVEIGLMEVRIGEWRAAQPTACEAELKTLGDDRKLLDATKSTVEKIPASNS
jgi:type II secretory pathway component GspD/PulD (secretin)